jgi:cobalamin biosynthesis protein CbiG
MPELELVEDRNAFGRHQAISRLAGLLAELLAFEADLRLAGDRKAVDDAIAEYVERMAAAIQGLASGFRAMAPSSFGGKTE